MDRSEIERQLLHLEKSSPGAAQILADPFSNVTRQRQLWLMGLALVCVLLSYRLVSLTDVSYGPFKLTPSAQPLLLTSLKYICAYFCLAFLGSAYRDVSQARFANTSRRVEIARWLLAQPVGSLTLIEQQEAIRTRMDEIASTLAAASGDQKNSELFMDLYNEHSTKMHQLRAIEREIDNIVSGAWGVGGISRFIHISAILLEIIFPVSFAAYAIFII